MLVQERPLSNIQLELLKMYSHGVSDEQLKEIRGILVDYFLRKATEEADRLWNEKGWSNETMDDWLKGEDHD